MCVWLIIYNHVAVLALVKLGVERVENNGEGREGWSQHSFLITWSAHFSRFECLKQKRVDGFHHCLVPTVNQKELSRMPSYIHSK